MIKRLLLCAATFAAIACADTAVDSPASEPILSIAALPASDNQTGFAGCAVPLPLRAVVLADGVPKAGVSVAWSVNSGTVSPAVSTSDSLGIATTRWTLGHEAGSFNAIAAADAPGRPSAHFIATAEPTFYANEVVGTNEQTAQVATTLPRKLQVQIIRNGAKNAGVAVRWRTASGSITSESTTNADGVAEATWELSTIAGRHEAYATVDGAARDLKFLATATAAPASTLAVYSGDAQLVPLNRPAFPAPLMAIARDPYGNAVAGVSVSWSVKSGPVNLQGPTNILTDAAGRSIATVAPFNGQGNAFVRATGVGMSVEFALSVGQPVYLVILDTNNNPSFRSAQNSTTPAVDTLAVGHTMIWRLDPFDYDQHSIEFVGMPLLVGGGEFPYASPSEVRVTFTQPGTYRYVDRYFGGTGTIVVR